MARSQKVKRAVRKDAVTRFKKRAPRALKEIRKFAQKMMGTDDVRVNVRLNECAERPLQSGRHRVSTIRCTTVLTMAFESQSPFKRLPTAVLQNIISFLDFVSWYSIQSIDPVWRAYPPRVLTFIDSARCKDFWESSIIESQCRFHLICSDSFYGGVVKPGGSCGVLLRILRLRPKCFLELTHIDLTAQCQRLLQVASLFSTRTVVLFPCLKSLSLRLVIDPPSLCVGRNSTNELTAPPKLEDLTLKITCCSQCEDNAVDSLHSLIVKVKRLQWLIEDDPIDKFVSRFPWPLFALQSLETSKPIIDHISAISRDNLQALMPNLIRVAIRTASSTLTISGMDKISELLKSYSHLEPIVWRPCTADVHCKIALSTDRIEYKAYNMLISVDDMRAMRDLSNATAFSMRCSSWNLETSRCLEFFSVLKSFGRLVDLTLPKELLMAWSKDSKFREQFIALSGVYTFPSVRRLHFASCDPVTTLNSVASPEILEGESCDSIFANVFRMFSNVKTLIIDPVPYFHCGSAFLYLTTFTHLKKLLIAHSRRLRFDSSARRLGLWKWLPGSKTLEVFMLYTQQLNWLEERTENGLLFCMQKNQSLRYVCIICELPRRFGSVSLTMADVERVANCWQQREAYQGKYIIFIFDSNSVLYCLTAKPKTQNRGGAHTFERHEFYRWMDLISAYPELYSVFWDDLASVLRIGGSH
ncbi:hypothetical protein TcWFU_001676 [Taenia crassiceps]|uniref:F-box domain-containing protein n=1 Tax=Taenia crassiceps TaxID=6207 RepID=A0ABR4QPB8_9CEST